MAKSPDLVRIVEAAYRLELSDAAWLENLIDVIKPAFPTAVGHLAFSFGAPGKDPSQLDAVVARDLPIAGVLDDLKMAWQASPEFFWAQMRSDVCGTVSRSQPALYELLKDRERGLPIADAAYLKGLDPSFKGCVLVSALRKPTRFSAAATLTFSHIGAHLAAAHRLRCQLAEAKLAVSELTKGAEAIIGKNGKLLHCEGPATEREARSQLRSSAVMIDRARGKLRRVDPPRAVSEWKGLVAARWTLVDHFENDGQRFLVARRNEATPMALEALAPREREVVGQACIGFSNKMIAYSLGLSASTVRVLLSRALKKLGYATREAMVAALTAPKE